MKAQFVEKTSEKALIQPQVVLHIQGEKVYFGRKEAVQQWIKTDLVIL